MRAPSFSLRNLTVGFIVCLGLALWTRDAYAEQPISGKPGVVLSQAVMNFSDLARREALHPVKRTMRKYRPEYEVPRHKELPQGAIVKLEPETSAPRVGLPDAAMPPRPLSPDLANSFPAESDDGTVIPPDTQGTVGPHHLVVALNSNVVVEARSGNNLKTVSLDSFWAPVGGISGTSDPRVVYDPFNDRWIVSTAGNPAAAGAAVLVGVSQTGDPTGNWNLYKAAVDNTGHHFCDFPTLGFNKTWVVIMCNVFDNDPNVNFFAGSVFVFDKFDLYNHGAGAHTVLDTGGDSNVTPASTYDNNLATEYLVEEYLGDNHGIGTLRLWAINGPVGSPSLTSIAFPATSLTWDEFGSANFGPQLGNPTGVDTGDARIGNVIYRNGTLWTTHPVFLPCCSYLNPPNPPTRSSVQWWQLDTSGNVLQRGLIDNPDGSYFRSYPSIAVNKNNDALIGYSRYSPNEYVGGFYSFRGHADTPNLLQKEATLKVGETTYFKDFGSGRNRWGDYSNTAVDPADDASFWTIQEYAANGSCNGSCWGTWWGTVTPPGPAAAFQVSLTPPSTTVTAGVPLTDFVVTVVDAQGHRVTGYAGTIHFTSSDPLFSMPDYTFSISDDGTHHFSGITLFKAGAQSIALTDAANSLQTILNFTVVPAPLSGFLITNNPTTTIAGVPFTFTVTAQDFFQNTITGYNGTVQFSSSDSMATLPANYLFQPGDNGKHTFGVTLRRAGSQNITVYDVASFGSVQGSFAVNVAPAAASHFILNAPANVTRTKPFTLAVIAHDPFENVATGYSGTVHFTTSDPSHTLPPDYTFAIGNQGLQYFVNGVTLNTLGAQTVTAADKATSAIAGSATINVVHMTGSPRDVRIRLGQPFAQLPVANFSEDSVGTPSASIQWGDSTSSAGVIVSDGSGGFLVLGSHTFLRPPGHPITVAIQDTNGNNTTVTGVVRMWPKAGSH